MGSKVVVFDVETDCSFSKCPGGDRTSQFKHMQVTVACALVLDGALCGQVEDGDRAIETAQALHWWRDSPDEDKAPFGGLLKLFDEAEAIVAYNGLEFDFPVLWKHYKHDAQRYYAHRLKCHDPFARLKLYFGVWPKLDALLMANSLQCKTASGLQAIKMWEDGRRDELLRYCAEDVRLLAQLVLLDSVLVPNLNRVHNRAIGIVSALRRIRACVGTFTEPVFA